MKSDVVGGAESPERIMPKQSGQKKATGKSLLDTSYDKDFHVDYRPSANRRQTERLVKRCRFCGFLVAANYLSEHLFFCRQEHGGEITKQKNPRILMGILEDKKNGVKS